MADNWYPKVEAFTTRLERFLDSKNDLLDALRAGAPDLVEEAKAVFEALEKLLAALEALLANHRRGDRRQKAARLAAAVMSAMSAIPSYMPSVQSVIDNAVGGAIVAGAVAVVQSGDDAMEACEYPNGRALATEVANELARLHEENITDQVGSTDAATPRSTIVTPQTAETQSTVQPPQASTGEEMQSSGSGTAEAPNITVEGSQAEERDEARPGQPRIADEQSEPFPSDLAHPDATEP